VDSVPLLNRDENAIFKQVLGQYDAPAYMRRARQVQAAYEELLRRCQHQRDVWLPMVRLRISVLAAWLGGDWDRLGPWLLGDEIAALRNLHAQLGRPLRVPLEPTTSTRKLQQALRQLKESAERFDLRWQAFLPTVDLREVNALRDGYNRYYVLEKECAVRSFRLARQGFRPLELLTVEDLAALFPLLAVPDAV
jgi:hypothetical protein